jgi:hypothetical protein
VGVCRNQAFFNEFLDDELELKSLVQAKSLRESEIELELILAGNKMFEVALRGFHQRVLDK